MDESYKNAVENLERIAKAMQVFQSEEDKALVQWNLLYLKLQPQYGEEVTYQ